MCSYYYAPPGGVQGTEPVDYRFMPGTNPMRPTNQGGNAMNQGYQGNWQTGNWTTRETSENQNPTGQGNFYGGTPLQANPGQGWMGATGNQNLSQGWSGQGAQQGQLMGSHWSSQPNQSAYASQTYSGQGISGQNFGAQHFGTQPVSQGLSAQNYGANQSYGVSQSYGGMGSNIGSQGYGGGQSSGFQTFSGQGLGGQGMSPGQGYSQYGSATQGGTLPAWTRPDTNWSPNQPVFPGIYAAQQSPGGQGWSGQSSQNIYLPPWTRGREGYPGQ